MDDPKIHTLFKNNYCKTGRNGFPRDQKKINPFLTGFYHSIYTYKAFL